MDQCKGIHAFMSSERYGASATCSFAIAARCQGLTLVLFSSQPVPFRFPGFVTETVSETPSNSSDKRCSG